MELDFYYQPERVSVWLHKFNPDDEQNRVLTHCG